MHIASVNLTVQFSRLQLSLLDHSKILSFFALLFSKNSLSCTSAKDVTLQQRIFTVDNKSSCQLLIIQGRGPEDI